MKNLKRDGKPDMRFRANWPKSRFTASFLRAWVREMGDKPFMTDAK